MRETCGILARLKSLEGIASLASGEGNHLVAFDSLKKLVGLNRGMFFAAT